MSQYCEYDKTSSTYDLARRPLDLDDLVSRIEGLATARGCEVADLTLLDVGAGSGNYYQALRERKCMIQYHGLEGSQGMIDQFRAKTMAADAAARGTFSLQLCDLKQLPLAVPDAAFDVVMITQVLHHLSDGADEHRPVYDLMAELGRATRPDGGFLWCSTQTPRQHAEDGFWWSALTPAASAKLGARFPPLDKFVRALAGAGYGAVTSHVPPAPLMREDLYLDVKGAFREEWRNCDSNWSMCAPEELAAGLARLRALVDAGEAGEFLAKREAARARTGQTTTVVATKEVDDTSEHKEA